MTESASELVDARFLSQGSSDSNFVDCSQSASRSTPDLLTMLRDAKRLLSLDTRMAREQISEAIVFLEKQDASPRSSATDAIVSGGLLPWQIRRLHERIERDLDSALTTARLARTVKLSTGYFCHAFKRTFGIPPHAYISETRVKRAQKMMLTTADPLSQIAAACGLADQSHLSRLFRKIVGQNPNSWRRANKEGHKSIYGHVTRAEEVEKSPTPQRPCAGHLGFNKPGIGREAVDAIIHQDRDLETVD